MTAPQQSMPNVPLVSQPVFLVDVNGNPIGGTISGSIVANAGTNLNTSALALESGGNLAAARADLDTMVAHLGPLHNATQVANTAGAVVVKGSSGYLWSATVTTLGTAQLDIYDNATTGSGTKLLSIPASAPVGSIYNFTNGSFAANGITSNGVLNCPAVTFQYS